MLIYFQGHVIMDTHINSTSTLVAIQSRIPYLSSLGIKALHLRDVLIRNSSGEDISHTFYPTKDAINTFRMIFNGAEDHLRGFTSELHKHNMTLVVQIPLLEDGMMVKLNYCRQWKWHLASFFKVMNICKEFLACRWNMRPNKWLNTWLSKALMAFL